MSDHLAQDIDTLATRAATPKVVVPERLSTLVVPEGAKVHEFNLDKLQPFPQRKTGHVGLSTHTSFARYVNDHKGVDTSLWADIDGRRMVAVFNDHEPNNGTGTNLPGWADFRATLQLKHTPEWTRWATSNGAWMSQINFAHHVTDSLPDIVNPTAADMLELAQTFSAKRNVDFGSAHRLADGQTQLVYKEQVEAKAGSAGQIEIPEQFTLRLAPFVGYTAIEINAWLRYRIDNGSLLLAYQLDQVEQALRAVFDDIAEQIATATGIQPYDGTPRGN